MFRPKGVWSDEQMERLIGTLLISGVIAAALTVLAGGAFYLIHFGAGLPDYTVFRGEPPELCSLFGIMKEGLRAHVRGVIQLGLLLLIATPVARVVLCLIGFAVLRDRTYVIVSLIVLSVLIYSLIGGGL
jgi:uncharacterized membrane protein